MESSFLFQTCYVVSVSNLIRDLRPVGYKNLELSEKDEARDDRLEGGIYRHLIHGATGI